MGSYTPPQDIPKIVERVHNAFESDKTRPIEWRKEQLKQLYRLLDENQADLQKALFLDLGKPKLEALAFEMIAVKGDIVHGLQSLGEWLAPETISLPDPWPYWQPTVHKQPKGAVLLIAPWNYPITLTLLPLVGIIASGCTAIIKPSQIASHTADILAKLIPQYLDPECYQVVLGDKEVVTELLRHPYGHIIYTGGGSIGSIVMAAAAKHLTPITLELGGKSPAVVSEKANLELAAKRIVWGKFWNAGQTCMAPDYVLVQESALSAFLENVKKEVETTYGAEAKTKMSHIVNVNHFNRVTHLLSSTKGNILVGGTSDKGSLHVAPTVVTSLSTSDALFSSEIFGPILPILTYNTLPEARATIATISETPLGLYPFSEDQAEVDYLRTYTSSGGMAVNDVMAQVALPSFPFGGFGGSGTGSYRGKAGVDTFSHRKSVVTVPTSEQFEGMLDWRYATGDTEQKYQFLKANFDPKLPA